jgi:hypothetical protein
VFRILAELVRSSNKVYYISRINRIGLFIHFSVNLSAKLGNFIWNWTSGKNCLAALSELSGDPHRGVGIVSGPRLL